MRRSLVQYPLEEFESWLKEERYAPGTRSGIVSRVRSLLKRMTAKDGTLTVTPEALDAAFSSIPASTSEASARVAWNAYGRFSETRGATLPIVKSTRTERNLHVGVDARETFAAWLLRQGLRESTAVQYSYRMTALLRRLALPTPERAVQVLVPPLFEAVTSEHPPSTTAAIRGAWSAYLDYCEALGLTVERLPDARVRASNDALPLNAPAAWAVLQKVAHQPVALPFFHALIWPAVQFRTAAGARASDPTTAISVSVRDDGKEYTWNAPLTGWRALWSGRTGPRVFEGWSLDQLHHLVAKGLAGRIERVAAQETAPAFEPPPR